MDVDAQPDNPYLLLTPGPLSTSRRVKAAMLRDWCTWDADYHAIVQDVRRRLVDLAVQDPERRRAYTSVLLQGSGTFCVEGTIGTAVPRDGHLLVLANGAYGLRIAEIAGRLGIRLSVHDSGETAPPDLVRLERTLAQDPGVTHVAAVHCETTTGMLNPLAPIASVVKRHGRVLVVDAMSSFGGIPMDADRLGIDFLVSSANKCIQGVPGFGFVVARRRAIEASAGRARSLSLDLHDQWRCMEDHHGKWRYTSPTHVVRAFAQALAELREEGGVGARHLRYVENQRTLVRGMRDLGFECLLPDDLQSPIITAFLSPRDPGYSFPTFYAALKARGFVIYPGKVTVADTFRIGNIGEVYPSDVLRLLEAVASSLPIGVRHQISTS